jgi:hypothetical protein
MPMKEENDDLVVSSSSSAGLSMEEDMFESMMKEEVYVPPFFIFISLLKLFYPFLLLNDCFSFFFCFRLVAIKIFSNLKRTAPTGADTILTIGSSGSSSGPGGGMSSLPKRNPHNNLGFGGNNAAASHKCEYCGKYGHFSKYCSNAPHPEPRMSNVPRSNVRKVLTLDGIDVSNKTVIKNNDGTYDIFEPSSSGLDQLKRDTQSSKILLSEVPTHLKCSLTGNLLTEAVEMPCCHKLVNDTIARETLLKSSLKCPFCSSYNVSPDSVSNSLLSSLFNEHSNFFLSFSLIFALFFVCLFVSFS